MKPKIIFFGTPLFAKKILESLYEAQFFITAVVTRPDTLSPRKILQISEVKKFALSKKIPIFQPEKIKGNDAFEKDIKQCKPDAFVVIAYGKILPKNILSIPKYGAINIHPSLLPKYRGPSPYQTALLEGAKETGVSIMLMDEIMDHGPILSQEKIPINPKETCTTLEKKLCDIGSNLLIKTIPRFFLGEIIPEEQDHSKASFTKIFTREDGCIDWTKNAEEIERMVRALNPWPGSFTFFAEKRLKILESQITKIHEESRKYTKAGILFIQNQKLLVFCGLDALEIVKLQLEGKKPQMAKEFIQGYHQFLKKEQ